MIKIDTATTLMKVQICSRTTALQVVDICTERMKEALVEGNPVERRGFGVFEPLPRKRGSGRNIAMGASVLIPQAKSTRFHLGKGSREIEGNGSPL